MALRGSATDYKLIRSCLEYGWNLVRSWKIAWLAICYAAQLAEWDRQQCHFGTIIRLVPWSRIQFRYSVKADMCVVLILMFVLGCWFWVPLRDW